ncbi:DUF3265 domain-containing protein, partial [Vibrio vulnificus]|nr:DUF3265 domain-containing protein [Vibrio vulnificus]
VCGDFCGESGLQKLGLGGTHPLTQRYDNIVRRYNGTSSFAQNRVKVV